ncbi:MAG: FecR domain-containing protein [Rhodospirillales bacterium]|nr:FecR domain-containing protein [Rhodospirillales bacterium]
MQLLSGISVINRLGPSLILGVLALFLIEPVKAAENDGRVLKIQGTAEASRGLKKAREITAGTNVGKGDIIRTNIDSRLRFELKDGTLVTLSESSIFVIDDFDYSDAGGQPDKVALRLVKGAFRLISGKLAINNIEKFTITTPVATIGIRGTDFWVGPSQEGIGVLLFSGRGIFVENNSGRVEINEPGQGTVVNPGVAPRSPTELMSLGPKMKPVGEVPQKPFRWPEELRARAIASVEFGQ